MKKFLSYLNRIEEVGLVILFAAMTVVCFLQVIFRYCLQASLVWSEEFLRACFVWSSCLGISYAFKLYAHLGVDFFVNLLPEKVKKAVALVSYVVCIVFLAVLIKIGYDFVLYQIETSRMTTSLGIPQAVITAAIPISGILGCIRVVQVILKDLKKKKKGNDSDTSTGEEAAK